jgi:hypothetical protein
MLSGIIERLSHIALGPWEGADDLTCGFVSKIANAPFGFVEYSVLSAL